MGLIDKLKVMFTEEVEETPIKKEMIQVEIPSPKEVRPQVEEPKPLPPKEEKTAFPIFFDDEDFSTLEKPKEKPKEPPAKPLNIAENYKGKSIEIKEKRVFKPTPIISPVYGILDKNYSKEDITAKKREEIVEESGPLTIDAIRNKAYGTLEDDLEQTFNKPILLEEDNEPVIIDDNEDSVFDGDIDMFDELKEDSPKHAAPIIDVDININEYNNFEMSDTKEEQENEIEEIKEEIESVEENYETEEPFIENDEKELLLTGDTEETDEELTKKFEEEPLNESDLFDLIDSMYDKEEE